MTSRLVPAALVFLSLVTLEATQFHTSTELVRIYATVQDRETRLVPDLTQDEFVVSDNGKKQPITFFSNEIAPFSVVVMLDRSGSMYPHQFVIRDAAIAFVQQLLPADKARIGSFGDYVGNRIVIKPSAFTSSKAELTEILRAPIGIGRTSPVWISIDQSVTALSAFDGRRVVLIFSDGYDQSTPSVMAVTLKDLIARVRQANVMVYALGFTDVQVRDGREKVIPPDKGLRMLADDSGGGYFEVRETAGLTTIFTRVAEELHRQYLLGFVPQVRDGKIHNIEVRVTRKDLVVRARQTYMAPDK